MATIFEALTIAVQHHQAGRLQAAEQIYRQILAVEPNQADAIHLLGVIASQVGKHEVAIEYIGRAIRLKGNSAGFHNNLGEAYRALRRLSEAVACYRRALQLTPDYAEAHSNLGHALGDQGKLDEAVACYRQALELRPDVASTHNSLGAALNEQGKLDEAVACYRRALQLKPDMAEAHSNLGNALGDQGKLDEAVACCHRALQLKPRLAEAHYNLGNALKEQGKADEAIAYFRRALELKPDLAEAYNNLGNTLDNQGKVDEAVACCRRALELKPDMAAAHNNLGAALSDQGKPDEAVACCRRALELKPDFADAHYNLGNALKEQGKLDAAIACYRQALELKPDYAEARFNQSVISLLKGDFEHGWAEYEWRWKTKQFPQHHFSQTPWDGRPLEGRTILLETEQGLGDTIQFVRYAALVKQRGATVIVGCPQPLVPLLTSCACIDRAVSAGEDLPPFDVHASLLSLPRIFHTMLRDIPATIPYLFAEPGLMQRWRQELQGLAGFKIGIAWQGNPKHQNDRNRSIPLSCFEPLTRSSGVRLLSLQEGAGVEQLQHVAERFAIMELGSRLQDFRDTAAVLKNLDLVITCDSALAHLAGALGVPVWVALPLIPDWRWLLDRNDSPWYPTMRLFRQDKRGDWQGVFQRMAVALGN
jgi:tetratricopeptide (TPR) repeat protein